tara:strand:- start:51210 stop:51932 length:723 start_codon:yes stop_codon:yes gene_type:complete
MQNKKLIEVLVSKSKLFCHPYIKQLGISNKALGKICDFITLEEKESGILNLVFTFKEPSTFKTSHKLEINGQYETIINIENGVDGIIWSTNCVPELSSEVLVFNDPIEALSYLTLKKQTDYFTAVAILPRTFKKQHILFVKQKFPYSRPICVFGNGQLAALQDAQFFLVHSDKDTDLSISYGLHGIRVTNASGKEKFYNHFSLRALIRDFYGGRYGSGATTQKPLKKYQSFKTESCQKKQ